MSREANNNPREMRKTDEDSRWRAVMAKDLSSDGTFVYAVRSTRIYCRPWCQSRRPRRQQVVFFSAPGDAERAGFRPCRRCQPRNATGPRHLHAALIARVCRYIAPTVDGLESPVTLERLGGQVGVSPHQLRRSLKGVIGVTPR